MKRKSNFQTSIGKYWFTIARIAMVNLILLLFPIVLEAATYYSRVAAFTFAGAGNNWSTTRTGGTLVAYPGTTHTYIIQTGNNVTIGAAQTAVAITVESGGTLTAGAFTVNSPITIDSGGTLNLANINALTMGTEGNVTNNGTISGTGGRLTMGANTLNNTGSITLTTGGLTRTTGALNNSGSISFTGAGQFTGTTGVFTNEATGTFIAAFTCLFAMLFAGSVRNGLKTILHHLKSLFFKPTLAKNSFAEKEGITAFANCKRTRSISFFRLGLVFAFCLMGMANSFAQSGTVTSGATGNWSAAGTWTNININRSGTVTSSTASTTVTGTSTNFLTELTVGSVITTQAGTAIGIVASIGSNTSLTLTLNASNTVSGQTYRTTDGPPSPVDAVNISGAFTVTLTANASCASVTFPAGAAASTLAISTFTLNVSGAVNMIAATGIVTRSITIGNAPGTLNAASLTIGGAGTATWVNRLTIATGTLNVTGDVTFNSGTADASALLSTSAVSTISIGGGFICTGTNAATFTPIQAQTMSLGGDWNFTGTMSSTNRLILTLNSTSQDQTISGTCTPRSLIINKAGRTAFFNTNVPFPNTAGAVLTVTAGTLDLSTFTADRVATANAATLSVANGATLRIGGTGDIPVNWNTWTFDVSSTVEFYGGAQALGAGATLMTYGNLTLSGSGAKTFPTGATTVNGVLSIENGSTANTFTGTLTYGASATLRYNTATGRTAGAEWLATFAATGGVIIANTGAITTNGNKAFNVDIPLNINTGATLSPATGNTFSFGGDLINDGTWTASDGAVTITLARTTQSIGRFNTTGLVTMNKASGTATFTGDINGGAFTMNSAAGTLNLGTGRTHTFTGAWTNTAGTLQGNNSTLNIGGTGSGTGVTFTAGTSTVNFNGAGDQNIPTFVTSTVFYNLNTATGGTKTLLGSTTVSNVLTVGLSSGFATGAFTLTLSGTGTPLVDNGTFTATAGSTVIYSGATANIAAESYANLQTSTAGVKTLAGNTTVATVLTVNSPSELQTGANTLTLTGTGTPLVDNGTFTASAGGTVIYSGATATVAGENYANLQVSTAGAKTLGASTGVSEVLTINTGSTIALSTFTLTLSGTGTPLVNSGGTFTPATGTVIYSGATSNITALTYYNLQTSTAGSKTLAGTTTVTNVLTINSPSTLNLSSFTINLSLTGTPLVNNGTIAGTGTVNFSGSGAQTVAGTTYPNLEFSDAGTKTINAGATITVTTNWVVGSTTTMTTTAAADVGGNISGNGAITMGSGTINIAGNWTNNGTFTQGTGTVIYDGTTQNIGALTYYNLQTSNSGSKTLAGTTAVNNILTINSPSTLDLSSFTLSLPLTGTPLVNNGTIAGTGTVNFSGSGAQTVAGTTYPNLEFSNAGTKTINAGATITVTTNWVVGSTTSMTTTAAADVGGNISGNGAITMGSGTINIAGNWTNNGSFTRGTGTVIYDGTTQTIAGLTYYNLQTSNSGVKTLGAGTTVTNILTIGASTTLDLSTVTLTLSAAGTPLVNSGTFTCSTSTVSFSNASSTNIPALNYYNLTLTGGPRVFAASGEIGIANIFTPGAGGFTVTGSTVNFNGLGAQTIPAFTFNDLVLSGSGAKTILTATSVTVFQITIGNGPTLDLPGTSVINITKP